MTAPFPTLDRSGVLSAELAEITRRHRHPGLLLSWGKDSLLLAHRLVRLGLAPSWTFFHCHDPSQPDKLRHVQGILQEWHLTVHQLMPAERGMYEDGHHVNLVARYILGPNTILDIPRDVDYDQAGERGRFLCGRDQWMHGQPCAVHRIPCDALVIGHKSADTDPVLGRIPLLENEVMSPDGIVTYFPLRDWTDAEVWDMTRRWGVPYDTERYDHPEDKSRNPDWIHACVECLRQDAGPAVSCPRFGTVPKVPEHRMVRMASLVRPYFAAPDHSDLPPTE
jgi:hypothetical protein